LIAHRKRPALQFRLRARRCRVHRISTRVRDDRDPPLLSGETGEQVPVICPTAKAEYFSSEDWTGQITLESFGKLLSRRIEKSTCKRPTRTIRFYTNGDFEIPKMLFCMTSHGQHSVRLRGAALGPVLTPRTGNAAHRVPICLIK